MFAALLTSSILVGLSSCSPVANYWLNPLGSVAPLNQYHAQDGSGSYRYGYTGPHHAKMETRSNGVTKGGYSYIDANGILQTVAYSADDENGFRVQASNLPQPPIHENSVAPSDAPEPKTPQKIRLEELSKLPNDLPRQSSGKHSWQLFQAPESGSPNLANDNNDNQHSQVQRDTIAKNLRDTNDRQALYELKNPFLLSSAEASRIEIPNPDPSLLNADGNGNGGLKIVQVPTTYRDPGNMNVVPLPVLNRNHVTPSTSYVLPIVPYRLLHSSLHHTQDSLGQYDYSYVGDTSSKTESRSLDGTTRGAYSYVDANGLLQQVHYVADHNGFRVLATNLPEA